MTYKFFIDYSTRNVAISGEAFVSSAASEEAAKQMVQAAMPKARLRVKTPSLAERTGLPVRFEPSGAKPADVSGHVWVDEKNPYAGNCEADWHWALYKLAGSDGTCEIKCEP